MKSAADYQSELALLETEAASCKLLVNAIPQLRTMAQRATTEHLLGHVSIADVQLAQSNLDEATQALARRDALARAIAETEDSLKWQRGVERRQFCESVAAEYQALYDTYLADCAALLATFKQLQAISNKHNALTDRVLMDAYQTDLHLPALHGPNDLMHASIPTGRR